LLLHGERDGRGISGVAHGRLVGKDNRSRASCTTGQGAASTCTSLVGYYSTSALLCIMIAAYLVGRRNTSGAVYMIKHEMQSAYIHGCDVLLVELYMLECILGLDNIHCHQRSHLSTAYKFQEPGGTVFPPVIAVSALPVMR
jgi:hypothetical protein